MGGGESESQLYAGAGGDLRLLPLAVGARGALGQDAVGPAGGDDYAHYIVKLNTPSGDPERGYPDREATVGKFCRSPTSHASQSLSIGSHNISWPTPSGANWALPMQ